MGLESTDATSARERTRGRLLPDACVVVIVLAALLAAIVSTTLARTTGFPDVPPTHPYYSAINELASRGIISGYGAGDFGPGKLVTRQQFAKMIVLACGYAVSESDICYFTDVARGGKATFYPDNYVALCATKGITIGKTATTFDPYGSITFYQMVTMVVRAADSLDPTVLAAPAPDWTGTAAWHSNVTHGTNSARAEYNGLLADLDLTTLDPSGVVNRGEVAQVLYNLLGRLGRLQDSTTTTPTAGESPTSTAATTSTSTTSTTSAAPALPSAFENLGGTITSSPAVCSQTNGLLDVFARGADGTLVHKSWSGTSWSQWEALGGAIKPGSGPAAVSWGPGRLDVFIQGSDSTIWHKWRDDTVWSDWENLAALPGAGPAAAYRLVGSEHWLDVFMVGLDGQLWQRTFDGTAWGAWGPSSVNGQTVKPSLSSEVAPALVSWGATRLDLFVSGTDNTLWHSYLPPDGAWSKWESLGIKVTAHPSVATWSSWAEGRLDVFVRGEDNGLWHNTLVSGRWSTWENMKVGAVASAPAAVSQDFSRVDLFVRGTDNALWHRWWNGTAWAP